MTFSSKFLNYGNLRYTGNKFLILILFEFRRYRNEDVKLHLLNVNVIDFMRFFIKLFFITCIYLLYQVLRKFYQQNLLKDFKFIIYRKAFSWCLRSSHPEVFCKKGALRISQNSQENTCVRVFFNKVAGLRQPSLAISN